MKSRINFFYLILGLGIFLLLVRLFELQIILGEKNLAIAEGNRIHQEVSPAPRGIIYDRNKKPLVRNIPVYKLKTQNASCNKQNQEMCFETISREEALKIEAEGSELAKNLKVGVGRDYLYGSALAHVLGYLNWELAGATGIEEKYNQLLKGQDGGEIFEVDTGGSKVREIERFESVPGKDLHLSIDAELSRVALEALDSRPGAVVATEAKTGQVLVLVSSPSFDPNLFVSAQELGSQKAKEILSDPGLPLFNRAIGGVYPPGSTFKIVTATAGLEEGKINADTLIDDPGVLRVGEYSYANWYFTKYGKTEGQINVVRALQRSTDTFFYKVGEYLGAETLALWAKAFGLGKTSGIDIGGEAAGLVPNPDWKLETVGEPWFLGNTYHFSIGQGDLLMTPLQNNLMTGVIANGGKLCWPKILEQETENQELKTKNPEQSECQNLQLKPDTLRLVKEGLKEACSPGGTSGIFVSFEQSVACKTGTAEFGPVKANGYRDTHAWFTAFAPIDDPQIVVTAVVEGGGEGSEVAAPIVKKVMEAWFNNAN